jgi:CRP/FNR family transcriptional regulator, cyclic AMP receptor protein
VEEAERALAKLPLFAGLPPAVLQAVAARTVTREVPRDTQLWRRGDPCPGLHLVLSGRVRVYRASLDGREQVLHTQGPGQALAEVPLFDGGPYPASARATEDTRLLFLARADFQAVYRSHPELMDAVVGELGRRLRRMVTLLENVSLKDVYARVAATVLEHAEATGALADGGALTLPRTQEELAAELGTTRESVARALARLRREGAIRQSGRRVQIESVALLTRAASP